MSGVDLRLCASVCVRGGVYELWKRFRPTVCARSSVSHQSATVETLDMPVFILVPAESFVLRAISSLSVKDTSPCPYFSRFRPVLLPGTGLLLLSAGI